MDKSTAFSELLELKVPDPPRRHFEANRLSRFLLSDRCPITGASMWGNIFDLKSGDIATAQLAVDGQIEHRQIARLPCTLKPSAINQTGFGCSGGFAPIILPLFQGVCLGRSGVGYS
jgi:hypothetical protein